MFLNRLGVKVRINATVTDIRRNEVIIKRGETLEAIPCRTVLWAAGVQASPLGKALAKATGAKLDRGGRIFVEPDLSLPNHPEIFVIGDLANYPHQTGKPLPGTAPVAIQQGRHVANVLRNRIEEKPIPAFRYRDRGNMAIVGRASAVAELGKFRFSGFLAWLMWLFVHLVNLVEFENRVLVLIQWGWYYFARNRGARLITGNKRKISREKDDPDLRRS
jgi:NADH dehydrogenase